MTEKKASKKYKIVLTMNKKDYKGEGNTAYDALNDIPLTWKDINNKGYVKVSYGAKSYEKLFFLG